MQQSAVHTSSATNKILGKADHIYVGCKLNNSIINDIQKSISSPYNCKHGQGKIYLYINVIIKSSQQIAIIMDCPKLLIGWLLKVLTDTNF